MLERIGRGTSFVERAARIAFAFVVMNSSAVAALGAVLLRKRVWGPS